MASAEQDAEEIKNAFRPGNINEEALINILSRKTNKQLMKISESYKNIYSKDLITELKKELNGHFCDVVLALFSNPIDYDCQSLRGAMKGIGTDDDTLIEIITTRPGYMIKQIVVRYSQLFKGRDLIKDIESGTSGLYKTIFVSLLMGNRSDNFNPDFKECEQLSQSLYEEDEKKWINEDSTFVKIITSKSPVEIALISRIYHKQTGRNILQVINSEFNGEAKKLLTSIVYAVVSPSEYFATRINKAIKGLVTNDKLLIRVIVTRREIDMPEIRQYYKQIYSKELIEDIKGDNSNYRKILVKLAGY